MKTGDIVRVISTKYGFDFYNRIGIVEGFNYAWGKAFALVTFFEKHTAKWKGYYYIPIRDLQVESEENDMAKLEGFKKVALIEQGTGCYKKDYYYALYDDDIQPGYTVLVTGKASGEVYVVKDVISADDINAPKSITAEVICKVDMTAYNDRVDKRKRVDELRKRMNEKRKEIEARKDDDYYASLDPDYAAMLEEMKSLAV